MKFGVYVLSCYVKLKSMQTHKSFVGRGCEDKTSLRVYTHELGKSFYEQHKSVKGRGARISHLYKYITMNLHW